MPSLAGAVTRLTLACVPGGPTWTPQGVAQGVADTYVPKMVMAGAVTGTAAYGTADAYVPRMTMAGVVTGTAAHSTVDAYVPKMTMAAMRVSAETWPVVDTFVPKMTMGVRWVLGGPRPGDQQYTALTLAGVPGRVNLFTAKPAAVADAKPVVDTYIAVLTLGDVTAVTLQLTDDYVPRLTMSATPSQGRQASDTYVPVLLMPLPNMIKSGTFPKFAADVFVPKMVMAADKQQNSLVVDTYVPRVTFAATLSISAVLVPFDTYVPVLGMEYSLTTTSGSLEFARTDRYVPKMTMAARVASSGEVDHITIYNRPYGYIRIVEE